MLAVLAMMLTAFAMMPALAGDERRQLIAAAGGVIGAQRRHRSRSERHCFR